MENKEISIKMIPLDKMIDILVELYNRGVDYIDLSGVADEGMDKLAISFTSEYMSKEGKEHFEEIDEDLDLSIDVNRKLSDEDLNELI